MHGLADRELGLGLGAHAQLSVAGVDEIVDHLAQEDPMRHLAGHRVDAVARRHVRQNHVLGPGADQHILAARHRLPVMLIGEEGTECEDLARYLHAQSAEAKGPFEAVYCGQLAPDRSAAHLFQGDLERGGSLLRAHGGTLYLDRPELLPPHVQEQLAAQFMPVGYVKARAELSVAFEDSLSRLSPATRRVVEANLDDIERSLKEISAALARDPGNTALQQLLVAASTQELEYLDEVRRLALNIPSTGA